ncbi:hypothetical protein KY335_00485 [Candidatus Woesearchaeota archaeon]|nr:hypothetical protein [Candidatus Woesearchaeota archaeon]
MNDKKFIFVLVGVIVILLLINVFMYDERLTGDAFRSVKRITGVKIAPEKIMAAKIKKNICPNNGCLWADTSMIFHISTGAVNYFGYPSSKEGSYELFSKNDLGKFKDEQSYHDSKSACVPEGTPLCVTKYKGKPIEALNGLVCIKGRWWIASKVCPLSVPDETSEVPDI